MDLFSNDYQVALGDKEQGLVAASQGSMERLAALTAFQTCLST